MASLKQCILNKRLSNLYTLLLISSISLPLINSQCSKPAKNTAIKPLLSTQLAKSLTEIDIDIPIESVTALGYKTVDELNLLGPEKSTQIASVIPNVAGKLYNFLYDSIFVIQTLQDADLSTLNQSPSQNTELFYTIRALEIFKTKYPELYEGMITKAIDPKLPGNEVDRFNNWVNRYEKIIVSYNTVSPDIAISGTYLDQEPGSLEHNGRQFTLYENIAVISIHPELIKGENKTQGSYPVYQLPEAEANYILYLKEGLLHSFCHEMLHRYIDIFNNDKQNICNYISFGNGRKDKTDINYDMSLYNIEEAMVNRTLDNYFTRKGGMSKELHKFYNGIEQANLNAISNLDAYKSQMMSYEFINEDFSLQL